jgi:hypothetical protein
MAGQPPALRAVRQLPASRKGNAVTGQAAGTAGRLQLTTARRRPAVPGKSAASRTSTTRVSLYRLRIALVASSAIVLAAAFLAFEGAYLTIGVVNTRGVPAVLYTLNARQAVVSANQAAASSFGDDAGADVQLTGAGAEYQAQINRASQSLEQIAAVNEAGTGGSQTIESIDGQFGAYQALIQQADASYALGENTVGAADIWHATQLMQPPGMLSDLSTLQGDEQAAVNARFSSFWTSSWSVTLWALPSVLMLAGLVLAQVRLARRFHRRISWPLVGATLLLFALAGGSVLLVRAEHRLGTAQRDLRRVVAEHGAAVNDTDNLGQHAVAKLLPTHCGGILPCGPTLTAFRAHLGAALSSQAIQSEVNTADTADTAAMADLSAADVSDGLPEAIPAVTVAIAVLILVGLHPRISEYRYQR